MSFNFLNLLFHFFLISRNDANIESLESKIFSHAKTDTIRPTGDHSPRVTALVVFFCKSIFWLETRSEIMLFAVLHKMNNPSK